MFNFSEILFVLNCFLAYIYWLIHSGSCLLGVLKHHQLFISVGYKALKSLKGCQCDSHVCSTVMINHILRGQGTLWWKLTKCFVMILSSLNLLLHIMTSWTPCPSSQCDSVVFVRNQTNDNRARFMFASAICKRGGSITTPENSVAD